ncbi:uncharacterized protein LOC143301327 [Babylonia areolata]|uniref:uncharacterized protein LOC143301327 n=1 Tax=Babylonia areolata TaxID=304850 RepID=UPI003FD6850C
MEPLSSTFDSTDIPICSVCDAVSLECGPLPRCSHPACPKCLSMTALHSSGTATVCRTCAEKKTHKAVASSVAINSAESQYEPFNSNESCRSKRFLQVVHTTRSNNTRRNKEITITIQRSATQNMNPAPSPDDDEHRSEEQSPEVTPEESDEETIPEMTQQDVKKVFNQSRRMSLPVSSLMNGEFFNKSRRNSLPSVAIVPGLMSLGLEEVETTTRLSEGVAKIREALALATKRSHCSDCLQDKKGTTPELTCMDCDISLCNKCSAQHKCNPANANHIIVPVERPRRNSVVNSGRPAGPVCLTHQGAELGMYCRNCEMLVCRECVVDMHLDCPGVVSGHQYASEEREAVQLSRVRYEQVLSFFSEQQNEAEEMMETLSFKKKSLKDEIRKFFSTLMKSCMDLEGSLLEKLETSVTDHTDLLKQQSSAWLNLQEYTQQLLEVTDVLHFLPDADFLPLSVASKASLSQALREGEMLAAEAPPHMTLTLSLKRSLQRSVLRDIKEIGSKALSVTSHYIMVLRKKSSTPFSAPSDQAEPQITSMVLLTQTSLLAADFNNSCLKLLRREEKEDEWVLAEVLPLTWRPYAMTQLLQKSPEERGRSEEPPIITTSDETSSRSDTMVQEDEKEESFQSFQCQQHRPLPRQLAVCLDDEETSEGKDSITEVHVTATSPSSGCFLVSVPLSGEKNMEIVQTLSEQQGCWGITAMDGNTLAVATLELGQCHISMIDMEKKIKWRLPLNPKTTSSRLQSPRHVLATSPTSLVVCDKGRKAIMLIAVDGSVQFTYTGQREQQLIQPEGMCMDSQGYLYITDAEDNSVTVLTRGGTLYSKTSSQQSDLNFPYAVCTDKNGCLYVANEGGKVLTVYDIIQTA